MTTSIEGLQMITPATCPEYRHLVAPLAEACWPEFMLHDTVADQNWGALFECFPEYQFGLLDPETNEAAAMVNSVPLHWDDDLSELPEEGWDWAFERAVRDHEQGAIPNIHCAIQIAILPAYQGHDLSASLVQAMRSLGRSKGYRQLIAPVRPSHKANYPLIDIDHYVGWKRPDGLPFDAWLRVHVRAGARIIKVCHRSMTIPGSTEEWQSWTGLSFLEDGRYYVQGALNPVEIDLVSRRGLYVEPNVWMVHELL